MSSSVSRQPSTWAWTAETNMAQTRTSSARLTIGNGFFMSASLTVDQVLLTFFLGGSLPGEEAVVFCMVAGSPRCPVAAVSVAGLPLLRVHPAGLAVPIDDNEAREQLARAVLLDARVGQVSLVHACLLEQPAARKDGQQDQCNDQCAGEQEPYAHTQHLEQAHERAHHPKEHEHGHDYLLTWPRPAPG